MDLKWCILALFETMFLKFELLRNFESKWKMRCILLLFESMFWNLELL